MDNIPLISIITVTFNAEKIIEKTLVSLSQQSFKDFEHLIIDGASQDSTLKIIKKVCLKNTQIVSEPDNGLYDAMNKGLRIAKGKYVLFLNAGDAFHTVDTLKHYAEHAKKGVDVVYGDTIIVDSQDNKISARHLSAPKSLDVKSFSKGMLVCHQAFMVKKNITSDYDLSYRFSSDFDWCVKCLKKARPNFNINLNEVTINYLNGGLTDKNKLKSLSERFIIMSRHYGLALTIYRHIGFLFRALKRNQLKNRNNNPSTRIT